MLWPTVGYMNAGTVEYLFTDDGEFAFLELNPRLQVEHTVTEAVVGKFSIPSAQLLVAMGLPLNRIPDVRILYGLQPYGTSKIDFKNAKRHLSQNHVIAARITAENPETGFQPTSGKIRELNFRPSNDVWGYFSIDSSGMIGEYSDSQFGHVFAKGSTREEARRHLVRALKQLTIRGDIHTTVEYLINLCETKDFVENRIDTAWLDKRIKANLKPEKPDTLLLVIACAAIRSYDTRAENARVRAVLRAWSASSSESLGSEHDWKLIYEDVAYGTYCSPLEINVRHKTPKTNTGTLRLYR